MCSWGLFSLYTKQKIKYKLYDHKDKYIYVGSGNPHCVNKNYRWFYGNISDVKIYDKALSASEVTDLYNGGLAGTPIIG